MHSLHLRTRLGLGLGILLAFGVTAHADIVNLTESSINNAVNGTSADGNTAGSFGTLNGASFVQAGIAPTGSGTIDSFVRLSSNDVFEQGYNTTARPLFYDQNSSGTFTRDLPLDAVPIFTCGVGGFTNANSGCTTNTMYDQFRLDINQTGSDPLLSLTRLVIYLESSGGLSPNSLTAGTALGSPDGLGFAAGTAIYDSGAGNQVLLDYALEAGSGQGDMFVYIPHSLFTGGTFVYLYSEFGAPGINDTTDFSACKGDPTNTTSATSSATTCGSAVQTSVQANNDGYEEWAVISNVIPPAVPEPTSILLLGTSLFLSMKLLRKKFSA